MLGLGLTPNRARGRASESQLTSSPFSPASPRSPWKPCSPWGERGQSTAGTEGLPSASHPHPAPAPLPPPRCAGSCCLLPAATPVQTPRGLQRAPDPSVLSSPCPHPPKAPRESFQPGCIARTPWGLLLGVWKRAGTTTTPPSDQLHSLNAVQAVHNCSLCLSSLPPIIFSGKSS